MKITTARIFQILTLTALCAATFACSKSKSYSELLRDEEKATNWWLSNQKVINEIPEDSVFICGEDAPFYRMDEDGFIYMQVVNPGDKTKKARKGQQIFFRYTRTNILDMYHGYDPPASEGNAGNVGNGNSTSFRFDDLYAETSQTYGSGIQTPLFYLGLDCEVNLVLRSYYGFQGETGQCQPFIFNVKYFPAYY